jgi:hypothetical protein
MSPLRSVLSSTATSAAKAKTVMIIVTPTAKRAGCYEARLDDGHVLVTGSKQPFVDAARRLIDLGHDPTTVLVMRLRVCRAAA